jgi:phosphosulfolactate phosphohydrolase-like enzyme
MSKGGFMRTIARVSLALALVLGFVAASMAAEETVTGSVMCAKCTLKKADATKCQDVLVVKGDKPAEYYVEKNAVSEKFGHVCKDSKQAVVTGTVTEKDGKKWIAPSKMEESKS